MRKFLNTLYVASCTCVIGTLLVILTTGLLATNFIGQRLVRWWEQLLARIGQRAAMGGT